jgi:hypothetical protein
MVHPEPVLEDSLHSQVWLVLLRLRAGVVVVVGVGLGVVLVLLSKRLLAGMPSVLSQ